ncbi:heme oxygenase [Actinokineospora alba]|uniref:Heme oxygenase n=1 Tax=Actinokineospora alba TaxID=504798 RepID=A0A1H0GL95_9PSEU|nr:biliverdin-producing heme oxygenase [Actinokineospora alba]TDP69944.1 heme oxygenase [Actinokineospora alba]SDI05412.1 heme oxygenase [Actinokineospora alba]SDO07695.1 heme oxygenase [Actinokineospora alba]
MSEEIPFSQELRLATREGHDRAQESAYIVALLAGDLSQAGYAALAVQHYFIYDALESAATAMREDPVAGPFVIDALRRMPGLVDDLEALLGPDWRARIRPAAATAEYVDRVAAVSGESTRFVAHQYTRYLGDIAGGQVIRNRLRTQHGIRARFYDFDELGPAPVFRDKYRALLDSAPWSAAQRADLISEAQVAFELNTAVFEELAEDLDRYLVA